VGFSIFPSEVLTASFLGVVAFGAVVGAFGAAEGVLGVFVFAVAASLGVRLIVVGVAVAVARGVEFKGARGVEFRGARGVGFKGALGAVLLAVVGVRVVEDEVVLRREEGLEVVGTLFIDDMRLDTPLRVGLLFSSTLAMRKGWRAAVAGVLLVADLTDALLPGRAAVDNVGPLAEELPNLARGGRVLSALPPAGVRPDMAMVL
jgi:Na+-transporting NADH:ubiquinone oxidoreductase subunit NqrE